MADIAAVVIQTLQWVGAPVTRQFQYLCCFSRNITNLTNEANQLKRTTQDLQGKVDAAKNDLRVISSGVEIWLQNSNDIENETRGILHEVSNVESGCLKLGARFFLSRRAKKTTDRVKELRGQCEFDADAISQPAPAAARKETPTTKPYKYESRKQIEENIMETLRGGDVNMIGICGMGGLGKTTMAKTIMNRALEEHVFEEVVMAVVSRPIDKLKIQDEIGGSLGLKLEGESSQARLQKLYERLSGEKRTLVILDDVWEELVLEDLGIPSRNKGCTILFTSRNRDDLSAMGVQNIFGMKVLSEEESWNMFRERVGTCVDNTELNSVARKVVNECKGLPLALIAVGAALKNEVDVNAWKNAVERLGKGDPDIQGYSAKVYNPLKLSYDVLDTKYKLVFLLCCVYPEDADIPLEQLTYFRMGLRIATGNVEAARNRIRELTKVLKNRSLLLDSDKGDEYVRMHDVVRDVCIFIAKQEGYICDDDLTSSLQRYKLHSGFELLQIRNSDEEINFDGITDLYVLSIERCSQLTALPFTQVIRNLNTLVLNWCPRVDTLSVVGELVHLEILICRYCYSVKELPPKIKGLNLKVLDLTGCKNLQRIGRGIVSSLVGLEELRMLGSFKKWEGEDREERENAGLRELGELTKLRCLEIEIEDLALAAENIVLSSEIDRFTIIFYQIKEFVTLFGFKRTSNRLMNFHKYLSNKKMCINWEGATCLGDWIKMLLLRDTECLLLVGNGANEVGSLINLQKIRYLELGECERMKKVVTSSMDERAATVFPSIEHLHLFNLPKLEEICDERISSNSFQNLKILKLNDLPVLKQLWKSSQNDLGKDERGATVFPSIEHLDLVKLPKLEEICDDQISSNSFKNLKRLTLLMLPVLKQLWIMSSQNDLEKDFLPQLEDLQIRRCGMMETVFLWKGEDGNQNTSCHHITKIFPKLKELELRKLPNLISLCQGIEGIEFPLLKRIRISECKTMKGMVWNEKISGGSSNNASTHALFCPQQVSFGCCKELEIDSNPFCSNTIHVSLFNGLEKLTISKCVGSPSLFTSSVAGNFLSLEVLKIEHCFEMVEVIKDEEEKGTSGDQRAILFPKLHTLELKYLDNLVSFCELKCDVEFPSLRKVVTYAAPNMKNFTFGSLAAPNLESFKTDLKDDLLLQVPCITLKNLSVSENEAPLNCYQIHGSVFDRLEELSIHLYEGSMSLFSSSITGNLVNLTTLTIAQCHKMVKVIEEKEEEKEKVVSGAQRMTILFPKLQQLQLRHLPKLVRFCEWKCDVELPSLRGVVIQKCDNMKRFTLGHLNTPKLESVSIGSEEFGGVKDLNGFLQQGYLSGEEEEEKKKEKKNGQEIMEEQN